MKPTYIVKLDCFSQNSLKPTMFCCAIGNILEWYDVSVYAYFSSSIAKNFFPGYNQTTSLMITLAVFAIGYLARPIGGIIFGHIGDKMGRKYALQLSIILMAIPTSLIGLLPAYQYVGITAPLLLLLFRIMQGVSSGGELTGSISYLVEMAPTKMRGFVGGLVLSSCAGGVLLASLVGTLITYVVSPGALVLWGWRIAFALSAITGLIGWWMRKSLKETPTFVKFIQSKKQYALPVLEALKSAFFRIIQVMVMNIVMSTGFYMLYVWIPIYLETSIGLSASATLLINSIAIFLLVILLPITGWMAETFGLKRISMIGLTGLCVLSYPVFLLLNTGTFTACVLGLGFLTVFLSLVDGVVPIAMVHLFKPQIRYSSISIGYNVTTSVFGGTTPLVSAYLFHITNSFSGPAFYLIAVSVISLPAFFMLSNFPCAIQQ